MILLALIVLAAAVAFALVPVRATAVEYIAVGREPQAVNCGSWPFSRTRWSGDAGCDRARTRRIPMVMYVTLASVPIAAAGAVLMVASRKRPHG